METISFIEDIVEKLKSNWPLNHELHVELFQVSKSHQGIAGAGSSIMELGDYLWHYIM